MTLPSWRSVSHRFSVTISLSRGLLGKVTDLGYLMRYVRHYIVVARLVCIQKKLLEVRIIKHDDQVIVGIIPSIAFFSNLLPCFLVTKRITT